MASNKWLDHVKSVRSADPSLSYKEALVKAKETYKKDAQMPPKTPRKGRKVKVEEQEQPNEEVVVPKKKRGRKKKTVTLEQEDEE